MPTRESAHKMVQALDRFGIAAEVVEPTPGDFGVVLFDEKLLLDWEDWSDFIHRVGAEIHRVYAEMQRRLPEWLPNADHRR